MICGPSPCGCAIQSSTLTVAGDGSPGSPYVIEQAEFSDFTALEDAVAVLEDQVATLQSQMSTANTNIASLVTKMANRMLISKGGANLGAVGVGPTVGGTPLTVLSTNIGPTGAAGRIFLWAHVGFLKTVSTDRFGAGFTGTSSTFTAYEEEGVANTINTTGWVVTTGLSPHTIGLDLVRAAGTGTATTLTFSLVTISWLFIPDAI